MGMNVGRCFELWALSILILQVNAAEAPVEPQGPDEDPLEYQLWDSLKFSIGVWAGGGFFLLIMIIVMIQDCFKMRTIRLELARNQDREPELKSKAKETLDRVIFMNKEIVGWETRKQEYEDVRRQLEDTSRALIDSLKDEIDKYRRMGREGVKPGEKPPDELGYQAVLQKQKEDRGQLMEMMKSANAAVDARLAERREEANRERAAAVVQHLAEKKAEPSRMSRMLRRNQPDIDVSTTIRRAVQRQNPKGSSEAIGGHRRPEATVEEEEPSRTVESQDLSATRRSNKRSETETPQREEFSTMNRTAKRQREEVSTANRTNPRQREEVSTVNRTAKRQREEVSTANSTAPRQREEVSTANAPRQREEMSVATRPAKPAHRNERADVHRENQPPTSGHSERTTPNRIAQRHHQQQRPIQQENTASRPMPPEEVTVAVRGVHYKSK